MTETITEEHIGQLFWAYPTDRACMRFVSPNAFDTEKALIDFYEGNNNNLLFNDSCIIIRQDQAPEVCMLLKLFPLKNRDDGHDVVYKVLYEEAIYYTNELYFQNSV